MTFNPNQPRVESGPHAGEWGSGGGNTAGTMRPTDADLKKPDPPPDIKAATEFAQDLRELVVEQYGETQHRCGDVAANIYNMFPEGTVEIYDGIIPGEHETGGYHKIAKVGKYFIDVTADQFGMGDLYVFTDHHRKTDPDLQIYERFTRDKALETSAASNPGGKWLKSRFDSKLKLKE